MAQRRPGLAGVNKNSVLNRLAELNAQIKKETGPRSVLLVVTVMFPLYCETDSRSTP